MPNAKGVKVAKGEKVAKGAKDEKIFKLLKCNKFLDENNIETILVPRYNEWIKKYNFE